VLVFGAFANAAGMVGPVVQWQENLRVLLGNPPQLYVTTAYYFTAIIALPLATVGVAAAVSRKWGALGMNWSSIATRYSFALIPIGFGMWLAHYSFHFFTSFDSVIPALQRFAADHGWNVLGSPFVQCACCRPVAAWIPRAEMLMLDFGLLLSLFAGFRIAEINTTRASQTLKVFAPWALLILLLFICGIWILFQPMEMRGMLPTLS
jgi:hypothetical protein